MIRISGRIQEMSQADILDHVPTSVYMRIKSQDQHPEFRAYVIGEEGESEGRFIGLGPVVKRWARSAIQKLHDKIQFGLKAFRNHNDDNSHDGRVAVGETVGKFVRDVAGKLQTVIIQYIYPDYRAEPLDAASIEADIELQKIGEGAVDVDVTSVTGVALGDSSMFNPGFKSAGLILRLQEFAENQGEKNMPMTKEQLRDEIARGGYFPSDFFESNALLRDRTVRNKLLEMTDQEHALRTKAEEELKKLKQSAEEQVKPIIAERDKYKVQVLRSSALDVARTLITERNKEKQVVSPKALTYIEKQIGSSFLPTDEEKLKEEVGAFVDSKHTEFVEIFGDDAKQEVQKSGDNQKPVERSANDYFRM